ncbi:MAG: hydroxyethylthiazole kinase [Zestosphaera sp.]
MDISWVQLSLDEVRGKRPLVHNITNFVVMNTTANALLALGASPIMAHAVEELEDLVRAADSLVVNIGTLDEGWAYSMLRAVQLARELGKPVVLDPVGAGATRFRTRVALTLLENGKVSVVKGNFGEVSALLGEVGKTKGVDTTVYDESVAKYLVIEVARKFGTVATVTGPADFVSDGRKTYAIRARSTNVSRVIGRVTGLGCVVAALIGAYLAVENPLRATMAGLTTFKAAASKASEEAPYPGSFHVKLYDWLYKITGDDIVKEVEVIEVGP